MTTLVKENKSTKPHDAVSRAVNEFASILANQLKTQHPYEKIARRLPCWAERYVQAREAFNKSTSEAAEQDKQDEEEEEEEPDTYLDCVHKSNLLGMTKCFSAASSQLARDGDCLGPAFEQAYASAVQRELSPHVVQHIKQHWQTWQNQLATRADRLMYQADLLKNRAAAQRTLFQERTPLKRSADEATASECKVEEPSSKKQCVFDYSLRRDALAGTTIPLSAFPSSV